MTVYGVHIFPQHAELLERSAVHPDVARERGYVTADTKAQLARLSFEPYQQIVPALVVPVHDVTGAIVTYQLRADHPRVTKAGKTVKYETRAKSPMVIDVPPRVRGQLGDPAVPLWITEGARKADAAVSAGLCCIALLGVWNWRGSNSVGGTLALADWESIALKSRRTYLAFDSDLMTKQGVRAALLRLGAFLAKRGADVRFVYLPQDGEAKTGLDDYLAAGGSIDDLVTSATPELRTAEGTPPEPAHTRTPGPDQPEDLCALDGLCAHTPPLASTDDLLAAAVETVEALGVTGETRIIKGTYLSAVSQVLDEPLSLVVKGASAGGKSYSTRTTLRLFSPAVFYQVTAGSQRSLIFTDEEFEHRTIVMFEATALREVAEKRDGDMTAMIVRTLLSEGRIIYDITERGDDGKMGTRRITKDGPTNLIVTTTADNLHHENETRLLSLTVDESEAQTRAVMRRIAQRRNQAEPAEPPDLDPWHELFHWLKHHGEHQVYIPYADYLSENAAASVVRMRRDFGVLLGMIEAHAVLHQVSRKRDRHGRIIATSADYDAARDILSDAFAITTGRKVKPGVRNAVAAVEALGGAVEDVTVAQVARHLKRDRSRATRGLKEAADLGYLTNQETREGRAARYRLTSETLPEDTPALPETLPDDACASTPAQVAQVSPQVKEGCAPVRVCAGGEGEDEPVICPGCSLPLDQANADAGFTTHGGACDLPATADTGPDVPPAEAADPEPEAPACACEAVLGSYGHYPNCGAA